VSAVSRSSVLVKASRTGLGLFAQIPFQPGDRILKLDGPRFNRDNPIHQTESGANLLQTGWRTYILLKAPAVYANHSCDPNAGIKDNRELVAIRAIAPGEEICFDYSTTMAENFWTMRCLCGSPQCRGTVKDFRELPPPVQKRYLDLGLVQKFIARGQVRTLNKRHDNSGQTGA
jgi:hypothetical protein